MSFKKQPKGFATRAIHVGQDPNQWDSMAVIPPIVLSTTFQQYGPSQFKKYEYTRSGNPTRDVLEACLASLENGNHCMVFSSGLGATTTILSLMKTGDHLLCGDDCYGGTNRLFRKLCAQNGFELEFVDMTDATAVEKAIKPTTKIVWIESPTNPLLKVVDIEAMSKLAHSKNKDIIVAVDNTFLSAYFQRPLELGADISMSSLTKFMNGHTDVLMGAIVVRDDELHKKLRFLQNALGIVPSPFDCYQVNRSLKTLALRMEKHFSNGLAVAKFLEKHPFVERVLHPGLPSHPQHALSIRQAYGHSGIMTFFIKGGLEEARKFFNGLKVFVLAESLGGYESLTELPSVMTHASVPEEQRKQLGITDNLIRISVGLEDEEDLIADLDQALKFSQQTNAA